MPRLARARRSIASLALLALALFVVACGGSKPPPPEKPTTETADAAPADPVDPVAEESKVDPGPPEEKPEDPPPPPAEPTTFLDLKEEDPKQVAYDEIVAANMEKGYRLRVVIRKDSTFTVTTAKEARDGKLDAKQKKSFDKALKAADIKGELPKGGTCAGLPSSNIEIRAKGKVATYADQCAAEPTPSLAKLTALVHQLVGI